MKIALAQRNYIVGDFEYNTGLILDSISQAKSEGADLVIFSELSVCGYPPRDFLEFSDFRSKCEEAVAAIASECRGIAAIVGAPSMNPGSNGKPLYNTAFFLADGQVGGMAHKTLLPTYDVFDEYRYFEPNRMQYNIIEFKGKQLAITICEDLWNVDDYPLYVRNPMEELIRLQPDILINIAASPYHSGQQEIRQDVLSRNARKYKLPIFYVNQVGGQTELLFDGNSMVLGNDGTLIEELEQFKEQTKVIDLNKVKQHSSASPLTSNIQHPISSIQAIYSALIMGIRDYFHKMGFTSAVLGLSGGIDSAVTLVLAAESLGNENVKAILMPSRFSSEHSITDARELAETLQAPYDIISIDSTFASMEKSMEPLFQGLPFNLTEENIQARIRAVILMAIANKFGYILLNTSNKSEAAVGYGTIYGDMCGGLSILGDVYKTQVYELAEYINRDRIIIPENTINKPPSAELRPGQQDSDSLPAYEILDRILYEYIELRQGPDDLIGMGFDPETVKKVLRLVNTSEWKRHQTPPILRISPKAFGTGRRMPIVGRYLG